MTLSFDHLVIAAQTLGEGVTHVEHQLGVKMSRGGQHIFMGTHNALLRLGDECYLEVIAIDPNQTAPGRPRWFGLDAFSGAPRLVHWVARTTDIRTTQAKSPIVSGPIVAASRGALTWKITIPDDGALPCGGTFPTFIEWPTGDHIASTMPDQRCELVSLHIQHPEADAIKTTLSMQTNDRIQFETNKHVRLFASIKTPLGLRSLS